MKPSSSSSSGRSNSRDLRRGPSPARSRQQRTISSSSTGTSGVNATAAAASVGSSSVTASAGLLPVVQEVLLPPPPPPPSTTAPVRSSTVSARATARIRQRAAVNVQSTTGSTGTQLSSQSTGQAGNISRQQQQQSTLSSSSSSTAAALSNVIGRSSSSLRQRSQQQVRSSTSSTTATAGNTGISSNETSLSTLNRPRPESLNISTVQQQQQNRVAWIDEQTPTEQQIHTLQQKQRQQSNNGPTGNNKIITSSTATTTTTTTTPNSTITVRKGGIRSTLRSTLSKPTVGGVVVSSTTSTTQSAFNATTQNKIDDKYSSGDDWDEDANESSWNIVRYSVSDDNTNEGEDEEDEDDIFNTDNTNNIPSSNTPASLFTSAWNFNQQTPADDLEEIKFNSAIKPQQQLLQPQRQDDTITKMKMTVRQQKQQQQQQNDRLKGNMNNIDNDNSSRIDNDQELSRRSLPEMTTIEDLEHLLDSTTLKNELIDSNCIHDNSIVMIKSQYACTTLRFDQQLQDGTSNNIRKKGMKASTSHEQDSYNTSQLSCTGLSLGTSQELFTLSIQSQSSSKKHVKGILKPNNVLRYGSKVVLKLGNVNDKFHMDQPHQIQQEKLIVYVRQNSNDSSTRSNNDNGLVVDTCTDDSEATQNDNAIWTIIRYRNTHPVRIGMSVTSTNQSRPRKNIDSTRTEPVRYGEPILFRHDATGGVLSCEYIRFDDDNNNTTGTCSTKLTLVTNSYDVDRARHTINQPSSLLSRLQQSDLLVPSNDNVFTFCPPTTPPLPSWTFISSNSITNNDNTLREFIRPYLDGSYLRLSNGSKPINHQLSSTFHGDDDATKYLQKCRHAVKTIRDDQMLTASGQELLLLDQVMGSLLGLEGDFIRTVPIESGLLPIQFQISQNNEEQKSSHFDPIVHNLVTSIVALSTGFARVRYFVNQHFPGYEYGSVMHAMCEELDLILQEYQSNIVYDLQNEVRLSIQHGQAMPLRKLLMHTRDSLHMMIVLEQVCIGTKCKKGGSLINSLSQLKLNTFRGDNAAEKYVQRFLDAASVPYMSMLIRWMETGDLDDPDAEFMVRKVCTVRNNDDVHQIQATSWESIYELAIDNVLDGFFGTTRTVEQVLTTGRYWNALRKCSDTHHDTPQKFSSNNQQGFQQPTFNSSHAVVSSYVKELYDGASNRLMTLLLDEYDLFGSLRLMKRYFLIEHGDFFVNFLDVAEGELQKDLSQISRGRVQNWLNGSVQITERNTDLAEQLLSEPKRSHRLDHGNKYDDFHFRLSGLRCRFALLSLTEFLDQLHSSTGGIDTNDPWTPLRHTYSTGKVDGSKSVNGLSGLEAFFIEFAAVPFPISLVLTPRAIAEYQLLFRHLFFAKHVERRLVSIWQDHQFMKELQSLRGTMGQTFLLRQRMLHFMQNLIYYMMFEVIEPNWMEMEESVMGSHMDQTVDDILKHHDTFLRRALDACLLTNRGLVRALTKLMRTCLLFTDQMKRFLKATKIEDDRITVAGQMQKVVQRKMNDRRHSMDIEATDRASRKLLRMNIQKARMERQQRVHRQTVRVQREVSSESYQRMVHRFEEVFSDNLREFMTLLTRSDDSLHTHKVNLCIRLDYNGYVSRALT
jgi:gamma-tubulin complex component 2